MSASQHLVRMSLREKCAQMVHIACASAEKAKLWLVEITEAVRANASTKPAWRILLVNDAVIVGSCRPREMRRPLFL